MPADPNGLIADGPMKGRQTLVVVIAVCLFALDGFDVLAVSFAAPGITTEWGIDRQALGVVLSMELLGMGLGSIALGGIADRIGRRRTTLACLVLMTVGMVLATGAHSVLSLCVWRVLTGIGIGGMLAAVSAITAEFSSRRRRDLAVALMAVGYPLGAIAGGSIAALLLAHGNWRSVFGFGAIATAAFLPVVYAGVPESVAWLCRRQPRDALARVNRTLNVLGYAPVAGLPVVNEGTRPAPLLRLFQPDLAGTTLLVTTAYFLHITTFYFILKWVPKIVHDMGFSAAAGAGVLVWANIGGAIGGTVVGLLAGRLGLRLLTIIALAASAVMVTVFGAVQPDLRSLSAICAVAGFCTNGGVVGLYGLLGRAFPPEVRSSGTGFALGVGRGGAILSPILAGELFTAGYPLQTVAEVMAVGSLLAAVALMRLRVTH